MRRISVEDVGKKFRPRSNEQATTIRENFLNGFRRARRPDPLWALRDVSFEVHAGEAVGIVGTNGSGKTTLLRLLGGIYAPDEGTVQSLGRVHGVLELNTGMHPDLTGRENAILASILSGCLRQEAEDRLESIIEFSEIRHSIDKPFRTYSSGMKLRLGFAVAVHVDPEIFLIDEVIAVGDLGFQYKCIERIREIREKGASIVMVSHDLEQLSQLCDRAVWVDNGRVAQIGEASDVVSQFRETLYAPAFQDEPAAEPKNSGVQLVSVKTFDQRGRQSVFLDAGAPITIEIKLRSAEPIPSMIVDVSLYSEAGDLIVSHNTESDRVEVSSNTSEIRLALDRLDLSQGTYLVSVGIFGEGWSQAYDYRYGAVELNVIGVESKAPIVPPRTWSVNES